MKKDKTSKTGEVVLVAICFIIAVISVFVETFDSTSSSKSSSSTEKVNKCGDTMSEHYAKTRKCNKKDNEKQNCTYSNCTCTCRPR